MKVIIAGSRKIENYGLVKRCIEESGIVDQIIEVVHGDAKGVDTLAKEWGNYNAKIVTAFPADWKNLEPENEPVFVREGVHGSYNVLAGKNRNLKMGDYGEALIAIWDGKSTGTLHMISVAKEKGLQVILCKVRKYGVSYVLIDITTKIYGG